MMAHQFTLKMLLLLALEAQHVLEPLQEMEKAKKY